MNDVLNKHCDRTKGTLMDADSRHTAENALWGAFRNGHREALDAIFEKYVRTLYAYGSNMTRDNGLISDCIQDLFVELWVRRSIVTPEIHSIKHYLIKSVRRRILRRLSADRRVIGPSIPEDYCQAVEFNVEFDLVQEQLSSDVARRLKRCMANLSKGQQEALYLKFYENLSYEQIASVMGTNVKAVYNLVGKSIISLRKVFKTSPIAY